MSTSKASVTSNAVSGMVAWPAGRPADGAVVTAVHRCLRSEDPLGQATTDAEGRYRIDFTVPELPEGRLNLVVRASHGKASVESPALFRAGAQEEVNLVLPGTGAPEYTRLHEQINPFLDGLAVGELREDSEHPDISLLAGESGVESVRVAQLALAQRHADATKLPAELFYGLLRQGLPADLSALGQRPPAELAAAINAAAEAGVIGPQPPEQVADFTTQLRALEVAAALHPGKGTRPHPLAEILAAAVPDEADQDAIYNACLDHQGTVDAFWESLADNERLCRYTERLRLALRLGQLTADHPPLVRRLLQRFDTGEFHQLRDLATLSSQDWLQLVAETGDPPASDEVERSDMDAATRADRYVGTIEGLLADAYPAPVFARRMADDPAFADSPAAAFLRANPEFDLRASQIDAALRDGTLPDGADSPAIRAELGTLQRLYKIAPDYGAVRELRAAGIRSAHAVARMGRNAFVRAFGDRLGTDTARQIHDRALRTHAGALTLLGNYHTYNYLDVPWLPKAAAPTHEIPNWEELFLSLDYCSCQECRSVYSPAAYLVDLLSFLGDRTSTAGTPVSDVLFARRDDLRDIKLTCGNTNTLMPYTDLALELLESAVAPATAVPAADRQTTGTTEELRAQPQHVNPGAYETLRTAVYPWALPFDLWGEQVRASLGQLGVARADVMTAFRTTTASTLDIAAEYLGLSTEQCRIITADPNPPTHTLPQFYGRPADLATADLVAELQRVRALLDTTGMRYGELDELRGLRFLNPSGLLTIETEDSDHPCDTTKMVIPALDEQLLDRLHRFILLQRVLGWPARDVDRAIAALTPGILSGDTIRGLTTVQWLIHRLGLTLDEVLSFYRPLDTYDGYLGTDELDRPRYDRLFTNPAVFVSPPGQDNPFALRPDRTELAVIGDLDDSAVGAALIGVLGITDADLAALLADSAGIVGGEHVLNLHTLSALVRVVDLARALQLPIADLLGLFALSGKWPFGVDANAAERTRQFVAMVDAITTYGFTIGELDTVLNASAAALPDDASLATTLTNLRAVLAGIARDTADDTDERGDRTRKQLALLGWDAALIDEAVATLLGTLTYQAPLAALPAGLQLPADLATRVRFDQEAGLLTVAGPLMPAQARTLRDLSAEADYRSAVQSLLDQPGDFVQRRMKALVIPITAVPLASLPAGYVFPPEVAGKVFYDPDRGQLRSRGYLTDAQATALRDSRPTNSVFQEALTALLAEQEKPAEPDNALLTADDADYLFDDDRLPADRFHLVLTRVLPYLCRQLSETAVKQKVAEATGLDRGSTDLLLGQWLRSSTRPLALLDLLADQFVHSDPAVAVSRRSFPDQMAALTLVHRVALVLTQLRLTGDQLRWVFQYPADTGWLDLNHLPATPSTETDLLFEQLMRLLDAVRLRDTLPGGAPVLGRIWEQSRHPSNEVEILLDRVAVWTGWTRNDLAILYGPEDLTGLRDERALLRLCECFRLLRLLGVSADRATLWASPITSAESGQAAWLAAKAKYPLPEWWPVAAGLRDGLRERQRATLVAYLVANPFLDTDGTARWSDTNGLYEHFLIDVEMTPAQLTSRIVQALGSIQLFVQRCLLNLEPEVMVDTAQDDKWAEWDWRSKYRLWEANQKVWLYPENWLEPELRDDKTPFFTEFEDELRQKEITPANTETAFLHYLEKLGTVSRLLPCGMYHERDSENGEEVERLHVVARTDSRPHTYYYRTWRNRLRWTPWEKIDLDVEGDTVVPIVWNRCPHIFWLTFVKRTDSVTIKEMPSEGHPMETPQGYWEVQLNWSQYRNGIWQPKKTGKDILCGQGLVYIWIPGSTLPEHIVPEPPDFVVRPRVETETGDLTIQTTIDYWRSRQADDNTAVWGNFHLSARAGTVTTAPLAVFDHLSDEEFRTIHIMPPWGTLTYNNEFRTLSSEVGVPGYGCYLPDPSDLNAFIVMNFLTLARVPGVECFHLLYPHQYGRDWTQLGLFYTDGARSYLILPVDPEPPTPLGARAPIVETASKRAARPARTRMLPMHPGRSGTHPRYADEWPEITRAKSSAGTAPPRDGTLPVHVQFVNFYHPYLDLFISLVNRFGLPMLFDRVVQTDPAAFLPSGQVRFDFQTAYSPQPVVATEYPREDVDFEQTSAYSQYNWELFFHAPLLVAQRLSTNQRFEEAQRWFHTIFDPTDRTSLDAPQRFWRTKPFFDTTAKKYQDERIEDLLRRLADGTADPELLLAWEDWRENPFQPDVVARHRTTAYQKAVVMKYLDNLIAWGDQLFRQDSMESVNEATQLYVLAAEILGRRPDEVTRSDTSPEKSYRELTSTLDRFADVIAEVESLVSTAAASATTSVAPAPSLAWSLHFCLPKNDKLLGYWSTVADRLFKIRHGQNIVGVERRLALFEPELDVAMLVRAAAAGLDLGEVLRDVNAPVPPYRFATMATKAAEIAAEVRSLGAALLSALEKRDAEALARLRSGHELSILEAARQVRQQQVAEAEQALAAVQRSRALAEHRRTYYSTRPFMNAGETAHNALSTQALRIQEVACGIDMTASALSLLPEIKIGTPTTIGETFGGGNLAGGLKALASSLKADAGTKSGAGGLAATLGGYQRRAEDWQFQAEQAGMEIEQLDSQIAAAQIRLEIAQRELDNHELQIANAKADDDFLRSKFTNQELYDWMTSQLSSLYFASYQLAYDVAKRAEQSFRYELALPDTTFIQFGYWDSLHQGLLAGERLAADLKRMEAAHLENNRRELELTKRISLAQLDPEALLRLKTTGECFATLPEALFDLDCPGHYLRRIRSVGFSIPCVVGPYANLHCTATLLNSSVRTDPKLSKGKYARQDKDTRFRDYSGSVQMVVTSTGQDRGLFDTEPRDDRYLPFEGSGVISQWHLKLPTDFPQFDLASITDVVITMQYTARDGGQTLAGAVVTELKSALNTWMNREGERGLSQIFSARTDFNDAWNRFLYPQGTEGHVLRLPVGKGRFPYLFAHQAITVDRVHLLLTLTDGTSPISGRSYLDAYAKGTPLTITATAPGTPTPPASGQQATNALISDTGILGGTPQATFALSANVTSSEYDWQFTPQNVTDLAPELKTTDGHLNPDAFSDLVVVLHYKIAQPMAQPMA